MFQATSIWLLALLKNCPEREPIKNKLEKLQEVFMDFLSENSGKKANIEYFYKLLFNLSCVCFVYFIKILQIGYDVVVLSNCAYVAYLSNTDDNTILR